MDNINMDNIKYSKQNYDSTLNAFFRRNVNENISEHFSDNILNTNFLTLIDNFKLLNLPANVVDFFINNNAYECEIYINNYTFFSITKILEIYEYYKKDNIINIIDIGYIYQGMGHINVIYYNTKFNKFFFRNDGGSNGHEREFNYNNMKILSQIDDITKINNISYDYETLIEKINNI